MSAAACLRADRSSRLHRPKSRTTLVPSSRARIPSRTRRPSITSEAEGGFSGPKSAFIHSSLVSRRALCSASMRRAAVVLPVPGNPTVRNRVGRCICPCLASKLDQLARRNRPARLYIHSRNRSAGAVSCAIATLAQAGALSRPELFPSRSSSIRGYLSRVRVPSSAQLVPVASPALRSPSDTDEAVACAGQTSYPARRPHWAAQALRGWNSTAHLLPRGQPAGLSRRASEDGRLAED